MNTIFYILIFWLLLLVVVYGHFFYEVKGRNINFSKKLTQLRDAFTEEE